MMPWMHNGEIAFCLETNYCGETACTLCHNILFQNLVELENTVWSRLFTTTVEEWLFSAVPFMESFITLLNK